MSIDLSDLTLMPIEKWYGVIVSIPTEIIKPDLENLRKEFDEEDIKDLGNNMISIGQLDEITVFPILFNEQWVGHFDLHDGERRWRAAQMVGIKELRAKIVQRPTDDELLQKKVSRVLQTRTISPEQKVFALESAFMELGIISHPQKWDSMRQQLGGGSEWPQIIRILKLDSKVRKLMDEGLINYTIAHAIGRLPIAKQKSAAEFVVINKINGRFFSTQMVPYMLENPDTSIAQAFEHARVGGWKQFSKSPYQKGQEPPLAERVEAFLDACVKWERAWEVLVHTGLVHDIAGDNNLEYRLSESARRICERSDALYRRIQDGPSRETRDDRLLS